MTTNLACWTLTYPCGTSVGGWGGIPHFSTEALAQEEAATHCGPLGAPEVSRLDRPCITVACSCGYAFDADEEGEVHFASRAEAAGYLPQYGWTQTGDGWRCETCTADTRRVRVVGDLFHGRVPAGAVYVGRAAPGLKASPYANPHCVGGTGCRRCPGRVHDLNEASWLYGLHLDHNP
ncbi:hypothetical protein, partial [Streptosporangium sp. NPDC004631]